MRPSTKPTGEVWRLLEEWRTNHPLRPNQSQMAGLFGVSTSLLSNWKYRESVMQVDDMRLVSEKTGIDFATLATAVADDVQEIPRDDVMDRIAARRGESTGQAVRRAQDEAATRSQDTDADPSDSGA